MPPNPIFRKTDTITALSYASEVGFGALTVNGDDWPLIAHVPFVIDGNAAKLHLVRSNPIARVAKDETPAKIIVNGPHSYVSPDWYNLENQVPTWNYVSVHLIGRLIPIPQENLLGLLEDLSEEFETRLLPKPVWRSDKMDESELEKMTRMIQPFRFEVDDVHSTYKLNQNKPNLARQAAAESIASHGIGSEVGELAKMMKSTKSEVPE